MTIQEVLNKIAFDEGYTCFGAMMNSMNGVLLLSFIEKAMILYAQQFIDAGNAIIGPATEILPDTYDEDYEQWFNTININQ